MTALEPVFVDTWGWLALGHRRDAHHTTVQRLFRDLRRREVPIYTSDHVLDELITLLFRREVYAEAVRFVEALFAAAALGQVRIERATADRFAAGWALRKQFQDKPRISFTDFVSMAIMREHDIHQVVTQDEHFLHAGMGFTRLP